MNTGSQQIEFFNDKPYLQCFGLVVEEFNLCRIRLGNHRNADRDALTLGQ
jgi:hypothetical protein